MKYFPKICGERVYLSPICPEDAEQYTRWLNDPSTTDGLGATPRITTVEGERQWIAQVQDKPQFAIVCREDDSLLGNCGLQNVDHLNQTAEAGIFIGEECCRGKGYGQEALRLLLSYGFLSLNLQNIMLRVYSFNQRAMETYRRVGFREMGRRRRCRFVNGAFHDEVYMDLLREEFFSLEDQR